MRRCGLRLWAAALSLSILVSAGLAEAQDAAETGKERMQETQTAHVEEIMENMSLRDKLAQMMFFSVRQWKESADPESAARPVTAVSDRLRTFVRDHRFGGVILFAENCQDVEQTLKFVTDMQACAVEGGGLPMLIGIDQEGGVVTRLGFGTSGVGNMALAAAGSPETVREMARIHGEELACLGIHVDFAPVLDVNDNPSNPVIGVRSFGDDAHEVARLGCAYMEGLHDAGVMATVKHFPGHGNTDVDSHTGLPQVSRTLEELRGRELVPFQAAIDAGAEMVMTAHIQFPMVEAETRVSLKDGKEIYVPATMSRTILTDLLRGEMGFDGIIVSDALDMSAIQDNYSMDDVLAMTINSGVNMLILPLVYESGMLDRLEAMLERAEELVESGRIDPARVEDSVRRILMLKQKRGLLEGTGTYAAGEPVTADAAGQMIAQHRETAWQIAYRALTLLKNEHEAAIQDNYSMDDVLAMTINSGVNMLILPLVYESGMLDRLEAMLERAEELVESGRIDPARVEDSVRRILMLKQKRGLLEGTGTYAAGEPVTADAAGQMIAQHRETAWQIAYRALTLLKNEHEAFPIQMKAGEKALVLFTAESRAGSTAIALQRLQADQCLPQEAGLDSMVIERGTAEACIRAAAKADHVLVVSRAWGPACLNPETGDGYPVGVVNRIIAQQHEKGKTVVLISAQLPYDAACYPEADAIVLAYASSVMRSALPETGAGSAFVPNLPAAICAAFGDGTPSGTLPVDIPALDESFRPTDRVLYPRGSGILEK